MSCRTDGYNIDEVGKAKADRNIAHNVELGLPAFKKDRSQPGKKVAIVGYGPSLADTWERLKDWDGAIWTCSKAHGFLLERGIVPHFHSDVDMRAHKAGFLTPHPDTSYVIASSAHPLYFERLKDEGITPALYHSQVDPDQKYDPRYPCLKVRFDAGLQSAEAAFQLGYDDQHWFGIDYGVRHGKTHAGYHGGVTSDEIEVEVKGEVYRTTQLFIHGLFLGELMLCQRKPLKCTVHGDSLLARFLDERKRTPFKWEP